MAPISLLGDDLVRLACAGRSVAEEPLLVIPVQRQFDLAGEPRGAEVDGLLAVKNRFDNSGGTLRTFRAEAAVQWQAAVAAA